MVLDLCWSYTNINPGIWHYKMAELSPDSVEENQPFEKKGIEYYSENEYKAVYNFYQNTNEDLKNILNLIFEIGTLDLYSSIIDNSPQTLEMLNRIIEIAKLYKISIPDPKMFKRYSIYYEGGWGKKFEKSDLQSDS